MFARGKISRGKLTSTIAVGVIVALAFSGCASEPGLADKYPGGGTVISADGAYLELPPQQRKAPVQFIGTTVEGATFGSEQLRGQVAVVNFWYAGCPPCRAEAPILAAVAAELDDVHFLGVNVMDDSGVAATFEREFGIEYPSILDAASGSVQLAFAGQVAPNAVPTTLILDAEGRVAARISGVIRDASILKSMIKTVQASG